MDRPVRKEAAFERASLCLEGLSLGDALGESFFGSDARCRRRQGEDRAAPSPRGRDERPAL